MKAGDPLVTLGQRLDEVGDVPIKVRDVALRLAMCPLRLAMCPLRLTISREQNTSCLAVNAMKLL